MDICGVKVEIAMIIVVVLAAFANYCESQETRIYFHNRLSHSIKERTEADIRRRLSRDAATISLSHPAPFADGQQKAETGQRID
jgi:hypothetical protein